MYVLSLKVQNELAFFKCFCLEKMLYVIRKYDKHTMMLSNLIICMISGLRIVYLYRLRINSNHVYLYIYSYKNCAVTLQSLSAIIVAQ